ncbi:DUF1453 domain-containing protein [Nocardia arthritidis]|uniref:DUF1453 domain-containing protein n=1 Tax=Nocardia arthritidis TaxID=228602 RepID=A0A6G9YD33_9NOCA|nr:DUF1453 domain-containing protein [Nocardia arthritidis]QIS11112.1 DUF1453 domain-containing protein [Nocardia arthritidis]
MSTWLLVAIIVGVIALVIKRFRGEPMDARDIFLTPLILVAIGVFSVTKVKDLSTVDITFLVIGGVIGIAFGAVRGTTVDIFERDGHLWQRYTVKTVVVWVTSFAVGFGVSMVGLALGMHHDARPTTLSIGIGMLGEMLTLGVRAFSTGVPFKQDGKEGGRSNSIIDQTFDRFLTQAQSYGKRGDQPDEERKFDRGSIEQPPTLRDGLQWLNRGRDNRR